MNCPDIGTLRQALDEPAALQRPPLAEHLDGCAACRSTLAELRRSADLTAPALGLLTPAETPTSADVAMALQHTGGQERVRSAHLGADGDVIENGPGTGPFDPPQRPRGRWPRIHGGLRVAAALVIVALALGGVVATPTGRDAAAGLLAQFRADRLQVVTFDPNDPGLRQSLWALHSVGTVDQGELGSFEPEKVASLAEAGRRVGFEVRGVPAADLPRGVRAEPTIYATPGRTVRFTFDREKAQRYVAQQGKPDVELPAKFDGASLVVDIPAAAVLVYPGPDDVPKVVVGQAGQLNVRTEGGVTLAEMREFLLGLPGLPEETARQLRAISDWRTTLPVFVPAGEVDWERTTVNGTRALSFSDRAGVVSAVVWQRDGRIYGVGGTIDEGTARRVAAGLG